MKAHGPKLVTRAFAPGVIGKEYLDDALRWLNEDHALVFTGTRTAIWTRQYDAVLRRWEWVSCSLADFKAFYSAYVVYVGSRTKSLAEMWIASPLARRYRAVVFDPTNRHSAEALNLWQGHRVTAKQGDCSKYKQHLWEVVAQENQANYDYIWSWMSDAVQHPERAAQSALVLRGRPGAGKSLPMTLFGELFGSAFAHISHQGQVTGRFNSVLGHKIIILLDEALWAGDRPGESVFKAVVTEKTFAMEKKGQEVVIVPNMAHLILCTNHEWAAPAGLGDRRIAAFDVGSGRIDDHPYFDALQSEYDEGGAEALLWDLQQTPLNGYRPSQMPKTRAKVDQSIHSFDDLDRWWYSILCSGANTTEGQWADRSEKSTFYALYAKDAKTLQVRRVQTPAELGKAMSRYQVQSAQSTMTRIYIFGPLDVCRADFMARVGQPVDWDDPPPTPDALLV